MSGRCVPLAAVPLALVPALRLATWLPLGLPVDVLAEGLALDGAWPRSCCCPAIRRWRSRRARLRLRELRMKRAS